MALVRKFIKSFPLKPGRRTVETASGPELDRSSLEIEWILPQICLRETCHLVMLKKVKEGERIKKWKERSNFGLFTSVLRDMLLFVTSLRLRMWPRLQVCHARRRSSSQEPTPRNLYCSLPWQLLFPSCLWNRTALDSGNWVYCERHGKEIKELTN